MVKFIYAVVKTNSSMVKMVLSMVKTILTMVKSNSTMVKTILTMVKFDFTMVDVMRSMVRGGCGSVGAGVLFDRVTAAVAVAFLSGAKTGLRTARL
jgi:hypothetical protein